MDPLLESLLAAASGNDLDTVLVLADLLEERGDPRAADLRRLYGQLYDDMLFAPLAFRHFNVIRDVLRPFFGEER
jgi:hypothetical protein